MKYRFSAIRDEQVPRCQVALLQHVLDTYASETNKVISVWSSFADSDLGYRPHSSSSSVADIMKHQLLSERRFFAEFLGAPEVAAEQVLPSRAAVEEFGIIDWMTMLQHSDPKLQQYEKSLLGDPVKDKKVYNAASPISYIQQVKAPLLVLQGDNDPRVPKEEAVQVVDLLKKDGKIVDAHYYPNEGHGFEKRENQIDAIRRTVAWFDKYLKGAQ